MSWDLPLVVASHNGIAIARTAAQHVMVRFPAVRDGIEVAFDGMEMEI